MWLRIRTQWVYVTASYLALVVKVIKLLYGNMIDPVNNTADYTGFESNAGNNIIDLFPFFLLLFNNQYCRVIYYRYTYVDLFLFFRKFLIQFKVCGVFTREYMVCEIHTHLSGSGSVIPA